MLGIDIRVGQARPSATVVVLPVTAAGPGEGASDTRGARFVGLDQFDDHTSFGAAITQAREFLTMCGHTGAPGSVHILPRPGHTPTHLMLVGVGSGDESGWRAGGAAATRSAPAGESSLTVLLAGGAAAAGGFAEGAWLGSYRFSMKSPAADQSRSLRRITLVSRDSEDCATGVERARVVAEAACFARDLTNTPSLRKSPEWFANEVARAARRRSGLSVKVWDEVELADAGFGGLLAVGGGSSRPPRLLEISYRPRAARRHIVLVGKGITFDTGGISIKPRDGMKLMRKDMGGAAAVCAAVLGAADLGLRVRVTVLAPLAENMISGSAFRPGDVIRHFGGRTSEVHNTDAEGRLVLADALAYAAARLKPDQLVDLATLTGASHVALGKRTAALFTDEPELARSLAAAGADVGEATWRLPLHDEYLPLIASEVADVNNAPKPVAAGTILAALFLREFTGAARDKWAHIDMSAPSWSDRVDGVLVRGATGWGARLLLRWLADQAEAGL